MFGYFGKLRFTGRRSADAVYTRASINISPRLILEFLRILLLLGLRLRLSTFDIGLVLSPGI